MRDFKIGRSVRCPADMGEPAYSAKVISVGKEEHVNIHGVSYRWVEVQAPDGIKTIWPSHRLG